LVRPPVPAITPESVKVLPCVSTVSVPLSVIAFASARELAAACNVVPLAKARVPVPSAVFDPAASAPAFSAVPALLAVIARQQQRAGADLGEAAGA
jgi:hypothetical protein